MTNELNTYDDAGGEIVAFELRPEAQAFVRAVSRGYDPADAAQLAGFERSEARNLVSHPRLQAAIRSECKSLLTGRTLPLAVRALNRIFEDPTSPPAIVFKAAVAVINQMRLYQDDAVSSLEDASSTVLTSQDISAMSPQQLTDYKQRVNLLLTVDRASQEGNS